MPLIARGSVIGVLQLLNRDGGAGFTPGDLRRMQLFAGILAAAVANARQKRQEIDVDRLYVHTAFVDGGPMMKRIQPAPMGRAFRILKRMCHVTVGLGERRAPQPTRAARTAAGGVEKGETAEGKPTARTRRPAPRAASGSKTKSGGRAAGRKKS